MKNCKRCEALKDLSEFSRAASNKDGRNSTCKPCVVDRNREYWRTPKGRISYIFNGQKRSSADRGHPPPTYTQQELTVWALQQGLDNLVLKWAQEGYLKDLAPSVDRLDDNQGYTLTNIRLVTWQENNEKMYTNRKSCERITRQNRKVKQLDAHGNVIATYDSIASASRITEITRVNINDVCRKKKHCLTAGGYTWQYA